MADAGDSAPEQTLVQLVPWGFSATSDGGIVAATPATGVANAATSNAVVISLLTATTGTFDFTDVPPGDYTVMVWWMAGFVRGGSPTVPDVYQAVLSIAADGSITRPQSLPAVWPGVRGIVTDPAKEVAEIGSRSSPILLKPSPPGLVPYPVSVGDVGVPSVGTV